MGQGLLRPLLFVCFLFSEPVFSNTSLVRGPLFIPGQRVQMTNGDLALRAFDRSVDDGADVEQIILDHTTTSFIQFDANPRESISSAIDLLQRPTSVNQGKNEIFWVASSRSRAHRIVGILSIGEVDGRIRQFFISYATHPHFRRQGLGRQMVGLMRDWLVMHMDPGDQILAVVDADNHASRALLETLNINQVDQGSGLCVHMLER